MEQWSENCAVTGLEIAAGEPVWMMILDKDYRDDSDGPARWFGVSTPLLSCIYDGSGGLVVVDDEESQGRRDTFQRISYLDIPRDNHFTARKLGGFGVWLSSTTAFQFLPSIPTAEGATVGELAKQRRDSILQQVMPYVGNPALNKQPDEHAARQAWTAMEDGHIKGCKDLPYYMDEYAQSEERALSLVDCDRDIYTVMTALRAVGRALVPSRGVEPRGGNHEAVSSLARFIRRKAIHAGFTAA